MEITLRQVADLVGGKLFGDEKIVIKNLAKIEEAVPGDLTFLYLPVYEKFFPSTHASAILVKLDYKKVREDIAYIEVKIRFMYVNFIGNSIVFPFSVK